MTSRKHHIENRRLPWIAAAALAALAFVPAPQAEAQIVPGTTITVNTVSDGFIVTWPGQPPAPPPCRLRDAIQAANTNLAVGGCPAGKRPRVVSANPLRVEDVDRIVFNVGTGTPDIVLRNSLPPITEAVTIDGATGGATRVEISGENIFSFFGPVEGVVVTGTFTTLKSLVVNGFSGSGIVLTAEDGDGVVIVTPARPERPDEIDGQLDPCGPRAYPSDPSQCPPPGGFPDDDVTTIGGVGGGSHTIIDCLVGTDAAGKVAVPNGTGLPDSAGIVVLNSGNLIGGADPKLGNVISGNRGHGVLLQGLNNQLINNKIGTGINTSTGLGNALDGVFVTGGQFASATCEVLGNVIFYNRGDGVDAGYNVCTLLANRISGNDELGIDRAEDGVTPNDPAGTMFRRPPSFPEIWRVTMSFVPQRTTISGVIHQRSPGPITVELFYSSSCDPSGNGEGASYLGSTTVIGSPNATQPAAFTFSTNKIFIAGYYTATATTEQGTSEFSACFR
jgi:hypothetical protein